jgi:hypothetical protein
MCQLPLLLVASALLDVPDSKKPLFINKFLNSNSAAANFNLATTVACAVCSA